MLHDVVRARELTLRDVKYAKPNVAILNVIFLCNLILIFFYHFKFIQLNPYLFI